MKFQWNKKYTTIAIYSGIVSIISVLLVFFFLNITAIFGFFAKLLQICTPILYGMLFAYVINPLMKFSENKIFRGEKNKTLSFVARRVLSIVLSMLTVFLLIGLFVWMIGPQFTASVRDLILKFPFYLASLQTWSAELVESGGAFSGIIGKIMDYVNALYDRSYELLAEYLPKLTGTFQSVALTVWDIVIGLIFSTYFLFFKERLSAQVQKILHAILKEKHFNSLYEVTLLAHKTIGRYFFGAILDAVIVGCECFLMMTIFGMPYSPMISVVIGATNLIPFFGPFLGAIPCAIILFVYRPIFAVYFALSILVIQQIDGNVVQPRIHGASTGLSPVWVIISITLMSELFGIIGMFTGVPVCSVIYAVSKRNIEARLQKKGMREDTDAYMSEEDRLHFGSRENTRKKKGRLVKLWQKITHKKSKATHQDAQNSTESSVDPNS